MTEERISLDVDQEDSLLFTPGHVISQTESLPNEHVKEPTDTDTDADTSSSSALLGSVEELAVKDSALNKQEYPLTINETVTTATATPQSDTVKGLDDSLSQASVTTGAEADCSDLTNEICGDKEESEESEEKLEKLEEEEEKLEEEKLEEEGEEEEGEEEKEEKLEEEKE
ncbi:hypothetical protein BGZ95_001527, partial [Linnemannia exigua]